MDDGVVAEVRRRSDLYLIRMMQASYQYGGSLFRIEAALPLAARGVSTNARMTTTGTSAQFAFWDGNIEEQRNYLVDMPSSGFEMTKIVDVSKLAQRTALGAVTAEEGLSRLDEIAAKPSRFGLLAQAVGWGLIGLGVPVLFSAAWIDLLLGFLAGLLAFGIYLLALRVPWFGKSFDFFTTLIAAFLAMGAATLFEGSNPFVVTMSAAAVHIPGFMLTLGLSELFMRQAVSGLNRITEAILVTIKLFVGAVLGSAAALLIFGEPPPAESVEVSLIVLFTFVAILLAGIGIVFQIRNEDFFWMVLCGLVAYAALTVGNQAGIWQGALLGGLALGLFSNIWARVTHRPSQIVGTAAVMVLMPGVIAYIGVFDAAGSGVAALGAATGDVLLTVLAVVAALIVAGAIVPPWIPEEDEVQRSGS